MASLLHRARSAALLSGRPVVQVLGDSEAAVSQALSVLTELLGALPQAELIEPWDEEDPAEPWELRVELPGLDAVRAEALEAALGASGGAVRWIVGGSAARRAAEDGQLRAVEEIRSGDVCARLWFDAEDGGVLAPDLVPCDSVDADLVSLELELTVALQERAPGMVLHSGRGPDTVERVMDRRSGRRGVQLHFTSDPIDALPGDEVQRAREAVVAAVAQVIRTWSRPSGLCLAPDLLWDTRRGLSLVLWEVAPPAQALPADGPVGGKPPVGWNSVAALVDGVELQVLPREPALHELVCERVAALALARELGARGATPRWLRSESASSFAPCWWVPVDERVDLLLDEVQTLAEVAAARIVPAAPWQLAERWAYVDLGAWCGSRAWVLRWQDGVTERDLLLPARAAAADPRGASLRALVAVALRGVGLTLSPELRPLASEDGLRGVELRVDEVPRVEGLVAALGRLSAPDLVPLIPVALRGRGASIQLWWSRA